MKLRKLLGTIKGRIYRNPRPALNDLDRKLEKYLDFQNGFFIEAGANDGYSQSNTYFLEKKRGWKGILVEGIPELFEKCSTLRTGSDVINCALVSNASEVKSVKMHFANLMSVVEGSLGNEDEQTRHIESGVDIQKLNGTYSVEVVARTLESILDELPHQKEIDFLSLDVEGGELAVLEGMNIEKYRPRYILVEARFFNDVNEFLTGHEYTLVEQLSHHDYLYTAK